MALFSGIQVLGTGMAPVPRLAYFAGMLAAAGFMLWVLYGTSYTLTKSELLIRCGPFRMRFPLADVESVTPTRNPLSSPACSLDRLSIRGRAKRRRVLISPEPKDRFLMELAKRCPGLRLAGDRLVSATTPDDPAGGC